MTELRPYQTEVIAEFDRGAARQAAHHPGRAHRSGKTVIAGAIIKQALEGFQDVLVLAHRREIISQTSRSCSTRHPHGIIQAGIHKLLRPMERVQVAQIQTLTARAVRSNRMELPQADLLVIDEAHHSPAGTYRKIIDAYPDAILLGLTATPCRGDGRGLGGIFETSSNAPGRRADRARTFWSGPASMRRYPDLKGVRIQAGDYNERQLAERMDRPN